MKRISGDSILCRIVFLPVILAGLYLIAGCNETFEPLQENDHFFFSIYGYLDVTTDTQWVRAVPVRESIDVISNMENVTTTLEHMGGSEMAVMNDSLFSYFHDGLAYNNWTEMELLSEETYRLTAEYADGRSSHVDVTMPGGTSTMVKQLRV